MNERKNKHVFNRFFSMIIALVFMITTVAVPVYGTADSYGNAGEVSEVQFDDQSTGEEYLEYEESADSWRFQDGINTTIEETPMMFSLRRSVAPPAWSKTENGFVNSQGNIVEGAVRRGVDVSEWQEDIDWAKVKADDIDFAIIRCGYGSDYTKQDDSEWLYNVKECERLGIPYGVYLYSYANTQEKAKSEAQHTLRLLKEAGADPEYPVYYDLEDKITRAEKNSDIVKFAQIYCSTIEAAGYEAGIYANYDWWKNVLTTIPADPAFDDYDIWVAQYNYECNFTADEYRLWQCTSSAYIDGIEGKVDLNLEFELENETNNITTRLTTDDNGNTVFKDKDYNIIKSQWVSYRNNTYYSGADGVIAKGLVTINGSKYYFDTAGKLQKSKWVTVSGKKYYLQSNGTVTTGYKKIGNYYYLFDSAGIMKTGTVTMSNKQYSLASSGISVIHTAKIKTKLNYRTGPSTKYKKKGTYKKGKVVSVIYTKNGWSQLTNGYWVKSSYTSKVTTYPKSTAKKTTTTTVKSYKVKTKTALNYRTGPSTKYKKKGTYKKGKTLTIVSTKNGWGKTNKGYWIKLSYTKKI